MGRIREPLSEGNTGRGNNGNGHNLAGRSRVEREAIASILSWGVEDVPGRCRRYDHDRYQNYKRCELVHERSERKIEIRYFTFSKVERGPSILVQGHIDSKYLGSLSDIDTAS
jgi:hypothetical protein